MNDLISRKAAIDALHMHVMYRMGTDSNKKRLDDWINSLPSAQPEQRWIPCSERLPEDEQPVLFSTKTGRVHQGKYYNDGSMNQWYSALDKMRAFNNVVNAWMPLPEPYKGGQDDRT